MSRPYIICHMLTSLDGKVTGRFLGTKEASTASKTYYSINRDLKCDGFVCGRVTMEESFTGGWYPDLTKYEPVLQAPDNKMYFIPEALSGFYAIAFDPRGKLGWKCNRIIDDDPGYNDAQIIEVLTEQTDPRYLAYLKEIKIPYIIVGDKEIDVRSVLDTLYSAFGIGRLLLEGGSIVNGYFQRAGIVDELSIVVAPVTADKDDKPLFMDGTISGYSLKNIREYDNNAVWLNYKAKDLT